MRPTSLGRQLDDRNRLFAYGSGFHLRRFQKTSRSHLDSWRISLFTDTCVCLTGYLLPWDNKAYWGTMVTTKILAGMPGFGAFLTRLIQRTALVW